MSSITKKIYIPLLWMIISLVVFYNTKDYSDNTHAMLTGLAFVTYILTIIKWISSGNSFFTIFTIFVIYSMFSNLGQSFLYSFTNFPLFISIYDKYDMNSICYMVKFQYLCASGLYLGTSLYVSKSERIVGLENFSHYYKLSFPTRSKYQVLLDVVLFICLAITFGYTIYQLILRQNVSYSEMYASRTLISEYYSFGTIILGILYIIRKRYIKFIYCCWVWFLIAFFIAGTRSMGIIYFGALAFCLPMTHPYLFRKKYLLFWILGMILFLLSISIISQARQGSLGNSTFDTDNLLFGLFSSINEMGISQTPSLITIEEVQRSGVFNQTLLYNLLLGFIPSGILKNFVPEGWTVMLGTWVNDISDTTGTQWGYSWISESYFNFGELGWIFTLIYGYFIAFAENYSKKKIQRGEYLLAICLISILCKQIFFARGQLGLVISFYKPVIYIFYIWFLFGRSNNYKINIAQ